MARGSLRGRAEALKQVSSMFRDTGQTVSNIFKTRADEKRKLAEDEREKPINALRQQLLGTQVESAQLGLGEKRADIESDKKIDNILNEFEIGEEMRESVKTSPMKPNELLNVLKSAKERPLETVQEYAEFLRPDSDIGKKVRSQLAPAQITALDGMLENRQEETPAETVKKLAPIVDPESEIGKQARSTEIFDPTEPGVDEKETVLQPGEKAPVKPTTSSFRFDVEEVEEPANVTRAKEILSKLEGARPTQKQRAIIARNQAIVDKFEARKEKLSDVESNREFQMSEADRAREFTKKQQKASFENQKKLKNMGFTQAKTLKDMEEAAKKAAIDPNRPNDTTINKENKDIWDKLDTKYTKSVSEHRSALDSINKLDELLDSATGASDIAAIFTFMKALDPRSVVRESEFKLPAEAAGAFSNMMNTGKQVLQGDKLAPNARVQLKETAEILGSFYRGAISKANARYTKLANSARIDPDLIINTPIGGATPKKTSTVGRFTIEEEE